MNLHTLIRPVLALCVIALPSCVGVPGEYGGYVGGYDDGPGYSSYQSRPSSYGGGSSYYDGGSSYYGNGYSRRPYYGNSSYGGSSRYYDNNDRHDHDDHRSSNSSRSRSNNYSSRSRSSSSDNDIRLVKVRDGTRGDIPQGYHSKEWYQKRGISVSKNTYETRDGDRRGYSGSSSKSKSSSKKKKD